LEQLRLLGEGAVAPDPVERPAPGGRRQPRARVVRVPVTRPALRRDRKRLLGCLLGKIEVPEVADKGREDAAPLVAEDLVDLRLTAP
jgi:hypothetical protein